MSLILRSIIVGIVLSGSMLLAQSTEPASPHDGEWSQQKEEALVRQSVEGVPSIGKKDARDLLRFSVENGYLQLTSPITDVSEIRQVDVNGLPGVSTINFLVTGQDGSLRFPQFKNWLVTPAMTYMIDVLSSLAGNVQVVYAMEGPLGSKQVELLQSPIVEEKDSVRLRVKTLSDLLPNSTAGDVDVSSSTWAAFVRDHAREASVYLRPTFRKLGAEQDVFKIDPNEAWQVLAPQWTEPPGLREKVTELLKRLDADDFRGRNAAAKELQQLGQPAAMLLDTIDRKTLSPEQISRIDAMQKAALPLSPEQATKLASDRDYLVSLLYNDDAALTSAVMKRLDELSQKPKQFDAGTKGDARLRAVDALFAIQPDPFPPATRPAP